MPLHGSCWFLCCRQGFSLLGREHGEKEEEEEEESFELRNKDAQTGQLEVTLSQPTQSANGTPSLSGVSEENSRLIVKKAMEDDPEVLVKGWLLREVSGGWLRQRRFWFMLTADSLDCYSGPERDARRLSMLVLTSLCSVLWPDKHTYKQTGYWSLTVYGRKHCYKLFTKHFNEAVHWACAVQKVIDSKAPVETPTQLLIRDIEENKFNPEVVEHIYQHNPILTYTQSPLYAPLLPFPYGSLDHTHMAGKGYTSVREEAVRLFNCLQQLESAPEPVPLIQGILQTSLDLRPLRDELYCQTIKQTSVTHTKTTTQTEPNPQLRYWQLLTCMSCTFLPSSSVLRYLRFHLKRVQSVCVDSEVESYAWFIAQALEKTRCRECVPSWEEIQGLMSRQEMLCTVHYPGPGCCRIAISSHTTANELVRKMAERLGLQDSRNTFALFEQRRSYGCPADHWERVIGGGTIIADVITSLSVKEPDSEWRLCFKLYCLLDTDNISTDSIEYLFLYEQCHEMVIRGQLPACEDDLLSLAALRLQAVQGDYSALAPFPALEQVFPARVLEARALLTPADPPGCPPPFPAGLLAGALWGHKRREEQDQRLRARLREEAALATAAILERWKALSGYSRRDSMAAYLTIARQWSGFGCTLYEVDFYISSTGSFSQRLWLGVAASCVSLYRQGEAEALECLPIAQICSYGVSDSNTFRITAGDRDLLFETSKLTEIMQLMNAYFSATRRQLGKDDCITMETTPKLRPSLLELPSHPV
ncbi:pleckstrin homology domain-containing family H member 3 isoform X2 [Pygocentrus nattereri]|uniref:pleckstrin homology domain-containing family H member 3 isoform X2 n=1 Tax=Pygocentrus nattereri TaxID=42514 RepID=UPI000814771C|nr:pleckstrin homology domain-containing family H member 3 isoform X2 [Pygocentrus nattereri]